MQDFYKKSRIFISKGVGLKQSYTAYYYLIINPLCQKV